MNYILHYCRPKLKKKKKNQREWAKICSTMIVCGFSADLHKKVYIQSWKGIDVFGIFSILICYIYWTCSFEIVGEENCMAS